MYTFRQVHRQVSSLGHIHARMHPRPQEHTCPLTGTHVLYAQLGIRAPRGRSTHCPPPPRPATHTHTVYMGHTHWLKRRCTHGAQYGEDR